MTTLDLEKIVEDKLTNGSARALHPRTHIWRMGVGTRTWPRKPQSRAGANKTDPREIDLISARQCTPDIVFPATACLVAGSIGAKKDAWGFIVRSRAPDSLTR